MKGFLFRCQVFKAVLVFACWLCFPVLGVYAEPFDAEKFKRDVREYRTLVTGGRALSRDDGQDWFRGRSPWLPFLEKQVSKALSPQERYRLDVALANRACGDVLEVELAAYLHSYPELRPVLDEADIGLLFREAIFPIHARAFSFCRALGIVEPLVAEARMLSEEGADEVDVHTVQYLIGSGRATATRPVELVEERLYDATFVLRQLAACHHHVGALEFLLRVEPQLKGLRSLPDQGVYLHRVAEALGIVEAAAFEPQMDLWDEEDRARIERIDRAFDDHSFNDAVRRLPYRDDACRVLPGSLARLHGLDGPPLQP